ncbi:MAG: penicillin-binding protein activator [Sedimenticolaceae bacterium]
MQAATFFRILFVSTWLILAAGCGQMPDRPSHPAGDQAEIARATDLVAAGQYLAAADIYRQLAERTSPGAQQAEYLLALADASRSGADWDGTRAALAQLQPMKLGPDQDLERRLLQAEVMLQERRPTDALDQLGAPPADDRAIDLRIRFYRDLAATYRQMGNLLETANALQLVDSLQTDPQQRLETQTEILRTLALLNEQVLRDLQPDPPGVPGGWMQLALLVKQHGDDPARFASLMSDWRQRFPQHPALPELMTNYQRQLALQLQQASRIAILLPQSGTFANVAAAIRDGIVVARFEQPADRRPELRFYDATDPAGIWPLYSQAVADGAELVIGPLQKDAVAQLVRAGELQVPVLALNQVELDAVPPANLFMYSLSPEDEARQAAERIWLDGGRHPIILSPQGAWGDRLADAFEQRWRTLGGSVAGIGRYEENSHDYTETITSVLYLDQSEARRRQIQGWLGRNVEFEPRRRDDADAIFMAARPVQAQGIRPQLQFHQAGDLPVYTTSHAWTGQLTANQAADMKGVMLADIPWLLSNGSAESDSQAAIAQYLPKSDTGYARLYAMGMDSLRLVPHLKRLHSSRYESLDGSTGNLYMDDINQVHRQLVWVLLDEQPQILGFAPRLDLQGNSDGAFQGSATVTDQIPLP